MSFLVQIKQLGKESLIYGVGSTFRQVLMVIIAPFLTYVFLPEEYGVLSLIQSLFAFVLMFTSINIGAGVFFHYFDKKESASDQRCILSTGYVFFVIMAVAMAVVVWFSAPLLNTLLSIRVDNTVNVNFVPYIRILSVGIFFSVLLEYFQLVLRILRNPSNYILVILIQTVMQLVLIVNLVFYLKMGLSGMFVANVLSALAASIVAYIFVKNYFDCSFSTPFFKLICSYSLPQFPSVIIQVVLTQSNRFFLNAYVPLVQLGYFSIAEKYANLLFLLIYAFILAWGPYALSIMKESFRNDVYRKVFNSYTVVFGMAYIGVSFLAKPLFSLFLSENYMMGYQIVFILALGLFFIGINNMVGLGISISQKTKYTSYIQAVVLVVNLTLNFLLIPKWGMFGAAIAFTLSIFLQSVFSYYVAKRLVDIGFHYWRNVGSILCCAGIVAIVMYWVPMTLRLMTVGLYFGVAIMMGVGLVFCNFTKLERKQVIQLVKRYYGRLAA